MDHFAFGWDQLQYVLYQRNGAGNAYFIHRFKFHENVIKIHLQKYTNTVTYPKQPNISEAAVDSTHHLE